MEDGKYVTFVNEAKQLPYVMEISCSQGIPINGGNNNTVSVQNHMTGGEDSMSFQIFGVDSAFLKVYDIDILEDRHLTPSEDPDFLVSDSTMLKLRGMGIEDQVTTPNGSKFNIAGQFSHFMPFSLMRNWGNLMLMRIFPLEKMINRLAPWNVSVRFYPGGDKVAQKQKVERLYARLAGDIPFESTWYEDLMREQYEGISQTRSISFHSASETSPSVRCLALPVEMRC